MGANIDAIDNEGITPLLDAISPVHDQCVPLLFALLKAKPNLLIRSRRRGYTPLEQAMAFDMDEVVDLLKAVGAKESVSQPVGADSELVCVPLKTVDGANLETSFSFWEAPVAIQDRALVEELSKCKIPALLKNFGWEASPQHWHILENTNKPIPLTRIAYFARGFFNRPIGKELEDGPVILGETYREAIDRFLSLGFLRILEPIELIKLLATVSDLKAAANKYGIKLPRTKSEMIEAVLARAKPEDFPKIIKRGPYYVNTSEGKSAVQQRGDWHVRVETRLRSEIVEALMERNLKWAFMLGQEIDLLNRRRRDFLPETVCKVRLVLENSIPDAFNYQKNEETVIRAIAAACMIVTGANDWLSWRSVHAPTTDHGEAITPSEFAFAVISNDDVEAWNTPLDE